MKGSLVYLGNQKWRGRIDVPTSTGKRKQKSRVFKAKSNREAEKMFEKWKAEIILNFEVYEEEKTLQFIVYRWEEHLSLRVRHKNLKESTLKNYMFTMKNILDYLSPGAKPEKIDKKDLQGLIEYLDTKLDLAPRYVKYHVKMLKSVLDYAIKENYTAKNPVKKYWDELIFPQVEDVRRPQILERDEIDALLESAKEEGVIADIILFAIHTGARRAEIVALAWDNIDFDEGVIYIEHQFSCDGKFDTIPPKSKHSKRIVPLTKMVEKVLKSRRLKQKKMKLMGIEQNNNYVFTHEDGSPIRPDYVSKKFRAIAKRTLIKEVTFHCTRHTFASNLIRATNDPVVVSEILGHFDPAFTMKVYVHLFNAQKKDAARKYQDFWQGQMDLQAAREKLNHLSCDTVRDTKEI